MDLEKMEGLPSDTETEWYNKGYEDGVAETHAERDKLQGAINAFFAPPTSSNQIAIQEENTDRRKELRKCLKP